MLDETAIAPALENMLRGIEPPAVPIAEIRHRMAQPPRRQRVGLFLPAAAAAIVLVLALPRIAPGVTQTIEQRVEAIVHWTPPPPPPASVESAMRSKTGTLAQAQARVAFTIVPPAGLPKGVVSERVVTIPTGVYSYATHRWSIGKPAIFFVYRRANGKSFALLADRFDPREGPPSKYIFDADERDAHGMPVRHENFAWRNGDQVMSAAAGEGLSAAEITAIRDAMHGSAVTGADRHASIVKQYRLPW